MLVGCEETAVDPREAGKWDRVFVLQGHNHALVNVGFFGISKCAKARKCGVLCYCS